MNVLPPQRRGYSLPFLDRRQETPSAMTFRFAIQGSGFRFRSNQAIRLQLPDIQDPWGPSRLFSISSSPTETDWIAITCKMTGTPFKEGLRALKPGSRVEVFGPLGDLMYDPNRPTVMIAGGIGITPFRGMIRYAIDTGANSPIVLLYSARTPEELAFRTELDDMAKRHPSLAIHYTVTRPQDTLAGWTGRTGRIDERLLRESSSPLEEPNFLVVGLPEMIESTIAILEGPMGVPEDRINWEPFRGY
jgi:glycine betaine catabolism B